MAFGDPPANELWCPHVYDGSRNYFDVYNSLAIPPGSRPTPEDDPIALARLQPWIDMMRDLLLESQLSHHTIGKLMRMYVPKKHHHAIGPIGGATKRRTFRHFSKLPSKIRFTIWRMAAARPSRVLFWQNDYDQGGPPLNSPADGPMAALACKEAWDVIKDMGCYFDMQGVDSDSLSERVRPIRVAPHDLIFVPFGVSTKPCASEPQFRAYDLVRSRKAVAVDYDRFVVDVAQGYLGPYRFLADMNNLETLVCIIAAPEVCIWTDDDNEYASPGLTKRQLQTTKLFQKIVLLQDIEEVKKVDMLWRGVGPEWRWLSRPNCDLLRWNGAAYAPKFESRCIDCAMRHWKETCVPQLRRTWVRTLYGEGLDKLCDERIYPNGFTGEPKRDNPWVQEALARMPKFEPAFLLMFKKRRPRYDEQGRCTNRVDRKGY